MISKQQAKYWAYELTKINKYNNISGISQALMEAQVDLNPHQIEAAAFAIDSPISKGVILADEVGLGKTIEAGIVLCQYWAERKRHLLIICPASLREQWKAELEEKFHLPTIILDKKNYVPSFLSLTDKVIIMSYNFAAKHEEEIHNIPWDLCTLDEAHKIRNVYKESNITGKAIARALRDRRKLLLTATPLQNSLMELYGLSTIIDDYIFGSSSSFKSQYTVSDKDREHLKDRLATFCKRTLRSQVQEYIKYTQRKANTFPFTPSSQELSLYQGVSDFLKKDTIYAFPAKQKQLTSLILYKLLASSSQASAGTLKTILDRLEKLKQGASTAKEDAALQELYEEADLEEEMEEIEEQSNAEDKIDLAALEQEISEIKKYLNLADSIKVDAKSIELLQALKVGFSQMKQMQAPKKALIFTESRRTQKYLYEYLSEHGYKDKIVLFFGGNKAHRTELIEQFKNYADIMIATEAGAEGLNMQFCSLVVNYDLPWNPQRVEQRIGRCHRYGQQHDVVVINFVNQSNTADKRVFELLDQKYHLFEGVFGASDEILGTIEDGVDFEKKILKIYQTCRTTQEINAAFDALQKEMETSIKEKTRQTRNLLQSNFDAEVHKRLKVNLDDTKFKLNEKQKMFWRLGNYSLKDDGFFNKEELSFTLTNPALGSLDKYYFITQDNKRAEIAPHLTLRLSHPIGEYIIKKANSLQIPMEEITFEVSKAPVKHLHLENLKNQNKYGWCSCHLLTFSGAEKEEYLVLSGIDNQLNTVDSETLQEILNLQAVSEVPAAVIPSSISDLLSKIQADNIKHTKTLSQNRNFLFFKEESDRINSYIDDKYYLLEKELTDVKNKIKSLNREADTAESAERIQLIQEELSNLTSKRHRLRRDLEEQEEQLEEERKKLISALKAKLSQQVSEELLFTFKWKLQ